MEADQQQLFQTQMFAQALTTPAMNTLDTTTPPPTLDPSATTIKMEDLAVASYLSEMSPDRDSVSPEADPSCPNSEQKGTKKRKSWGQVLPEPKTNLPPRKRAKTEDEKEQRRIERVKRNRLAAHNSRERKRQEVELLTLPSNSSGSTASTKEKHACACQPRTTL